MLTLSDIIEPEVFAEYLVEDSAVKSAFVQSGVLVTDPILAAKAKTGGKTIHLPIWGRLADDGEGNLSDTSGDDAVIDNIDADEQIARMAYINKAVGARSLSAVIAGSDPMPVMAGQMDAWYTGLFQRKVLAMCDGIIADNVANNGGDMVIDIAIEDGSAATEANLIGRSAVINASFTLGDNFDAVKAIALHSIPYQRLVENNAIITVADADGNLTIPTYLGKRVIVDDEMTFVAGATNGFKFTTVLFGAGAFGYGYGEDAYPVEVVRDGLKGKGGGEEALIVRKNILLHPDGFKFNSTTVAGVTATHDELRLAVNWTRILPRKLVKLAFLITNG